MSDTTDSYGNILYKKLLHNFKKQYINLKILDWISNFISNWFTITKTNKCISNNIQINLKISQRLLLLLILYLFYNANVI